MLEAEFQLFGYENGLFGQQSTVCFPTWHCISSFSFLWSIQSTYQENCQGSPEFISASSDGELRPRVITFPTLQTAFVPLRHFHSVAIQINFNYSVPFGPLLHVLSVYYFSLPVSQQSLPDECFKCTH